MMLNLKRALITSSIIVLLSALIATTGLVREMMQDEPVASSLSYILRVHSFLVIILALMSAATAMRRKFQHAASRVEILAYEATTDVLTMLPNRRGAREYFEQQIAAAERYGRPLSVIMIDVDHFKEINDTYGHDRGDRILIAVAETLKDYIRETDYVARWGGEEFLILAQHTHKDAACQLAERVRRGIEDQTFKGEIQITISLGVAEWQCEEDMEEVMQRADEAMYNAKTKGRNRVEVS